MGDYNWITCDCPAGINCMCPPKEFKTSKDDKMKTKEFKVEVVAFSASNFHVKATDISETLEISSLLEQGAEAKFLFEIPEKKIEITESQFEFAMGDILGIANGENVHAGQDMIHAWKQKLFGGKS